MMGNFYNMMNYGGMYGGQGFLPAVFAPIALVLTIWSLYWKYHAIWYAVKHDDKWWFIAFLLIHTLGILEIFYLYVFTKRMGTPGHDEKSVPMVP